MRDALHAELTKLRTLASTWWLVAACVGCTGAVSVATLAATSHQPTGDLDPTRVSLTGVDLGQVLVAILAVLVMSNEYGTGMIDVTLAAVPRRLHVLGAKGAALVGLVVPAAAVAVGGCLVAGRVVLPGKGFTVAHGFPLVTLADAATVRAAVGTVLYLCLVALLGLGIATAVRDSASAIGVVLGLLYLFPVVARVVSDPTWQRHLEQVGPMTAGLSIEATTNLQRLPIGPWAGLAVLAAWAAAALLVGGLRLCLGDA